MKTSERGVSRGAAAARKLLDRRGEEPATSVKKDKDEDRDEPQVDDDGYYVDADGNYCDADGDPTDEPVKASDDHEDDRDDNEDDTPNRTAMDRRSDDPKALKRGGAEARRIAARTGSVILKRSSRAR